MPRAKLSQAQLLRASAQLVAATQVKASGEVQAVEADVTTLASGVPANLQYKLDLLDERITTLESP